LKVYNVEVGFTQISHNMVATAGTEKDATPAIIRKKPETVLKQRRINLEKERLRLQQGETNRKVIQTKQLFEHA
jgi:hypothetical protein